MASRRRVRGVRLLTLSLLALALLAAGAAARPAGEPPPLRFGFNGGENPGIIRIKAKAFAAFLSERIGLPCEAVVAESSSALIRALMQDQLDFAFLSPLSFVTAEQAGVELLLKSVRGGEPHYWSVILVRADSGLEALDDLKGKRFAFTHRGSTSGYVIPVSALRARDIQPRDYFSEVVYAGGHSAAIQQLLDGEVDACATFADDPAGEVGAWTAEEFVAADAARQLRPIFFSEPIPGDTFCAGRGVRQRRAEDVATVRAALLRMGEDRNGHSILEELYNIDSLMAAESADYEPVRQAFAALRGGR